MPAAPRFWLAALILAGVGPLAQAAELPRPVCGRTEVLAVVADDIVQRGIGAVIVPGSVGEIPTGMPDTVRCSVRIQATYFDTNRFGAVPLVRLSVMDFTVRAGRNGLFVDTAGGLR